MHGPLTVTHFRDFPEDKRLSMDIYADSLRDALRKSCAERCNVQEYKPKIPVGLSSGNWSLRFARYAAYPLQASRRQSQVNHILDHGYGHLLYWLDPNRTVVTVHDLIPLVRWRGNISHVPRGRKPWLNLFSFYAMRRARCLIAISENTRQDLIQVLGCKPERIAVVYYGIEEIFREHNTEEKARARYKWNCPNDGTLRILISGSQFYKNLPVALRAYARVIALHNGPLELLKVGLPDPVWDEAVRGLGLQNSTRYVGEVSHFEMPELLNCVELLLFPSLYEGFGRPPLEAMACGVPVVTSNAAALPESVGDAGITCDPQDIEGLACAIVKLLSNPDLYNMFVKRGLERVKQFRWSENARKMLDIYEQIACD